MRSRPNQQSNDSPTAASFPDAEVTDVKGDWISLGAVDLQINGALGLAFPDLRTDQLDQLQTICELLWTQGVSDFCPTLVTTSPENFRGSLAAIQTFRKQQKQQQKPNSASYLRRSPRRPFPKPQKTRRSPGATPTAPDPRNGQGRRRRILGVNQHHHPSARNSNRSGRHSLAKRTEHYRQPWPLARHRKAS